MKQERIFNQKKRRVLRKQIPRTELLSSLIILSCLILVVSWFVAQRNAFNPEERDISFEMLERNPVKDNLYKPPLKPWTEPDQKTSTEKPALGFFPEAILDGDWLIDSPFRQFDSETLFEKINGEAERFLNHGFRSLQYIGLRSTRDRDEIAIELFDQGDSRGSRGVFTEHMGRGKTIKRSGPVFYFMTPAGAIGRNGRFFFRITGNRASDKIISKSLQLIEVLSGLKED